MDWIAGGAPLLVSILTIGIAAAISFFLVYIILLPLIRGEKSWKEEKPTGASAIIVGIETRRSKHIAEALGRDDSDTAIVGRTLSLAKAEGALLTLIHVADSAPAQFYSSDAYHEHTRDDEQGVCRIRHYGFLANRNRRTNLKLIRKLLTLPAEPAKSHASLEQMMLKLTGTDITTCPCCNQGKMKMLAEIPGYRARAPNYLTAATR